MYRWIQGLHQRSGSLHLPARSDYKDGKVLTGTLLAQINQSRTIAALTDVEFQVFSQFGDDGIIQYLVHKLGITDRTFVEFGVEDYTEANSRFLLVKDKWRGMVIDGDPANVAYIKADLISLFYDVTPVCAFITAETINDLIAGAGFSGRIGLLSVDIDGVDYWVWKAITVVDPAIVVAEYNAAYGPDRAITTPYQPDFVRSKAHPSRLYWGCSLAALQDLATEKGYRFIGCNGNGNNAYFLRADLADAPWVTALERRFIPASFAEYAQGDERVRGESVLAVIKGLPVFNVRTGQVETL